MSFSELNSIESTESIEFVEDYFCFKVMFLHLSIILFTEGALPYPLGRHPSRQVPPADTKLGRYPPPRQIPPLGKHLPGKIPPLWADTTPLGRQPVGIYPLQTPSWADTPRQITPGRYPRGRHHPLSRHNPLGRHPPAQTPPAQCMLGFSQQKRCTHPTEMESCL